jgi:hypothetical protein
MSHGASVTRVHVHADLRISRRAAVISGGGFEKGLVLGQNVGKK